ncbi:GntR family transcriptional regulator [Achromobacter marplatensis]|uniref:DNA-binding GntR family transcriptional regulator n=1 Tax=Achromobacter marplatensis TaxID=470868 RepID=A0ABX9GK37_9BURK|nr:GntR family transcriptional regulator [Achromobacter marplatensis]OWT69413.1 GntR family transcriptional regulator [Achromobacter marplatensis]RBP23915.1 DNA-binding GntR family transcriptional regulator [Achromobacter marplatensis]CAB3629496.1 HTH-type transcriptional repressor RspR [Achromobacter marplatensis]
MQSQKLRLDRSRHAAPQVFEHLREQIVSLELAPGTALSRVTLAETYGLSQTPIRDALMRLAEEALVEIYPQHTTVVSRIDIPAARQAHFLRQSLELEIVHLLAQRADPVLHKRLQASIDLQRVSHANGEYQQFIDADQAFHRDMHAAAGVTSLWELEQRYSGHLDRLRRLHLPEAGKAERIMDDHQRLLDAIVAQEPGRAQQVLREHLSGTLSQVAEICKRYPEYVLAE